MTGGRITGGRITGTATAGAEGGLLAVTVRRPATGREPVGTPSLVSIRVAGGGLAARHPLSPRSGSRRARPVVALLAGGEATWVLPVAVTRRMVVRVAVEGAGGRAATWLGPGRHGPRALVLRAPGQGRHRLRAWWSSGGAAHRALDAQAVARWRDLGRLGG